MRRGLPADGQYLVAFSSWDEGGTGDYALELARCNAGVDLSGFRPELNAAAGPRPGALSDAVAKSRYFKSRYFAQ